MFAKNSCGRRLLASVSITTASNIVYTKMMQLIYFGLHANLHSSQRIKVFENANGHDNEVSPHVKTLNICLTLGCFKAYLLDFLLIYYLIIDWLSAKMCTLAMSLKFCEEKQRYCPKKCVTIISHIFYFVQNYLLSFQHLH